MTELPHASADPVGSARAVRLARRTTRRARCGILALGVVATNWLPAADESPIFDGKSLSGWECDPPALLDAHWRVEDGMILGENPDKKGSVLWTQADHENYELELEYRTPSEDYDSGVFARGGSHQVQIGVSRSLKIDLTACIYAPKDGAGSYPARSERVKPVHRLGEWNHLRMIVEGKRIQTFLNGELFVDYEGKTLPERGKIGLQLHGGVHMKMLFRNLRLRACGEWRSLFDGKTLAGWDGDPRFWSVKDGALTGVTTKENPTAGNTFLIHVGENKNREPVEFADFELELEFRILAHNSGIQYRSFKLPGENDGWRVGGYQADIDAAKSWVGTNYGERFRGILAKRGEKVMLRTAEASPEGDRRRRAPAVVREVEPIGDPAALAEKILDAPEWNRLQVVARGHELIQRINGVTMSHVSDQDESSRRETGLIAVQLHGGPPMTIQVRAVRIRVDASR